MRGGLDIIYVRDGNNSEHKSEEYKNNQLLRIDVGVWTKKKIRPFSKTEGGEKRHPDEGKWESHWLRFEKFMGDRQYLGSSYTDGRFVLTDVDYALEGCTFYRHPQIEQEFQFRAV